MSLKIKVFLFASLIAIFFIAVMLISHFSAKERIKCGIDQKYELIYYTMKSQTAKLLDVMLYDHLNIKDSIAIEHTNIVHLLKQQNQESNATIDLFDSPFIDIAIYDLNFNLQYRTQNQNYSYMTFLLGELQLSQTPYVSMPIYEPSIDSFVGYIFSQNLLHEKEFIVITTFEYNDYKELLIPIIEHIQSNISIISSIAIINCKSGFSYPIAQLGNIPSRIHSNIKNFKKLNPPPESYQKKSNGDGSQWLYFIDFNQKGEKTLSLFFNILIDDSNYDSALKALNQELFLSFIVGFIFIIVSFLFIKQIFLVPLEKMREAIKEHRRLDDQKLLAQNDELGTLARNFNQNFEKMNEQIDQKNELLRQQDIFVKDSIHEIRTPLTIITLNNELRDKIYGNDKYSKQILAATKSLNLAYDDLSFSIEQDRNNFDPSTVNLSELLKQRIDFITIIAEVSTKKINLTTNCDYFVFMNYKELSRLIDNNLSNAIKYAYPHTVVDVSLNCMDQNEAVLKFSSKSQPIRDSEGIFHRYQREDDAKGGYGLGLSIVKKIANKYAIQIEVESNKGINHFIYKFNKGRKL